MNLLMDGWQQLNCNLSINKNLIQNVLAALKSSWGSTNQDVWRCTVIKFPLAKRRCVWPSFPWLVIIVAKSTGTA